MAIRFWVDQNCIDRLQDGQFLDYNEANHTFFATRQEPTGRTQEIATVLKNTLMELNKTGTGGGRSHHVDDLGECAKIFLNRQCAIHQAKLQGGLRACKHDEFLMNLEAIDRLTVALDLESRIQGAFNAGVEQIALLYKTQVARDQLDKWISEPTHRAAEEQVRLDDKGAAKHPEFLGETVIDRVEGARAFALHPWQFEFIRDHHLEKLVGTFDNERIIVDAHSKDFQIKYERQLRTITDIAATHISEGHRLYTEEQGVRHRVFYTQNAGLAKCEPEYFEHIPVFKTKPNRKHNDYRLEVYTVINMNAGHFHSWVGLKMPNGEVREVGKFRREGEEKPYHRLMETSAADFHAGDRYSYMRMEEYTKRTPIKITQEQYEKIVALLEAKQADVEHRNFNCANQNCVTTVNDVVEEALGFRIPVESSLLDVFLGVDISNNFLVKYIPPIRIAAFALCYIISVLRNLLFLIIGGTFWGDEDKRVFSSFFDVFNPYAGRVQHPLKLREWQERVETLRNEQAREINEDFAARMAVPEANIEQLTREKEERLYEIKNSLPEGVRPEEHSFWWYVADLFWSMSSNESVIPAP